MSVEERDHKRVIGHFIEVIAGMAILCLEIAYGANHWDHLSNQEIVAFVPITVAGLLLLIDGGLCKGHAERCYRYAHVPGNPYRT